MLEVSKIRIPYADTDNTDVSELLIVSSGDAKKFSLGQIQEKPSRLVNFIDGRAGGYFIIDTGILSNGGEKLIS